MRSYNVVLVGTRYAVAEYEGDKETVLSPSYRRHEAALEEARWLMEGDLVSRCKDHPAVTVAAVAGEKP